MADQLTGAMTPSQIEEGVFRRVGSPQGTSFESWRYNAPAAEGATIYPKSRRKMRMEEEYQKYQAQELNRARQLQTMEIEAKQFEENQRDQLMKRDEFYYNRGLKEADQKLKAQQLSEATAIISGLNQLDPKDPDYQQKRAKIFGDNPFGAADPNVQKVANEYGAANTAYASAAEKRAQELAQQQKDVSDRVSEARRLGVSEEEIRAARKLDPVTNQEVVDLAALQKTIDTTKGQRTVREEERKEGRGDYRPMSVEQAQDRVDVARAKFEAIQEEDYDETDEEYKKAQVALREAEAQLKVSQERGGQKQPESNLPQTGDTKDGYRYTGPSNDKKAASNPDNWVKE